MAEKKATVKAAPKAAATKKTREKAAPKAASKKAAAKKADVLVDAENAGFRAGDVYQALSAAGAALSVTELAAATQKSETEILLGIGWLLKEGKVKGAEGKVVLA